MTTSFSNNAEVEAPQLGLGALRLLNFIQKHRINLITTISMCLMNEAEKYHFSSRFLSFITESYDVIPIFRLIFRNCRITHAEFSPLIIDRPSRFLIIGYHRENEWVPESSQDSSAEKSVQNFPLNDPEDNEGHLLNIPYSIKVLLHHHYRK